MRAKVVWSALLLAAIGWGAMPLPQAVADGEPGLLGGSWQGEYIDVAGLRGRLFVELEVDGAQLRGSYRLEVPDEESVSVYRGSCEGSIDGVQVSFELILGKQRSNFSARLSDAMPYALQALSGTVENPPGSLFKGGVFMLWRFAD